MEELRIALLSILGLWFIVMNYRRRQGNFRSRADHAKHNSGRTDKKKESAENDGDEGT